MANSEKPPMDGMSRCSLRPSGPWHSRHSRAAISSPLSAKAVSAAQSATPRIAPSALRLPVVVVVVLGDLVGEQVEEAFQVHELR